MLYFLAILFLPWLSASAAGLQVSPASLEFQISNNEPLSQKIIVSNPSADLQLFEIYADDFTDLININPRTFSLESGDRQEVLVSVAASQNNGLKHSNLSIIARPFSTENIVVSSASKLPITISQNISATPQPGALKAHYWYIGGLGLLALLLLIYVIYLRGKFKKIHPEK